MVGVYNICRHVIKCDVANNCFFLFQTVNAEFMEQTVVLHYLDLQLVLLVIVSTRSFRQ